MRVRRVTGPLLMLASAVAFAAMNYFAKMATKYVPGSEAAFTRFTFGLVVVLSLAALTAVGKRRGMLATEGVALSVARWRGLIGRGILGGIAILTMYMAYERGNLTEVTAINYSSAAFGALFGMLYLRERLDAGTLSAMAACAVGVFLMVVHPTSARLGEGELLALVSAAVSGAAIVAVRQLRKTESTWTIFASLCLFGMVVCAAYGWRSFVPIPAEAVGFLVWGAITGTAAQVAMTAGYRYVTTAVGGVLSTTTVLFSAILGYFILGDRLSSRELVGALAIVAGSCLSTVTTSRLPANSSMGPCAAPSDSDPASASQL